MANSDLGAYNISDIQAIADAIRFKNGSDQLYKAEEMAQAIVDIQAGGYYDAHPYLDGKTHLWISVPDNARYVVFNLQLKRRYGLIEEKYYPTGYIDWGDDTEHTPIISDRSNDQYATYTFTHSYSLGGEYVITVYDTDPEFHNYHKIRANGSLFIYNEDSNYILKAIELNHELASTGTAGEIGTNSAFGYDRALENFIIGPGCHELGRSAFNGCYNLKHVDLSNASDTLTINNYYMFNNCYSLKQIDISNDDINWTNHLTSVSDDYMFTNCMCLESIVLPTGSSFNTIRKNDFRYTYNLKTIVVPDNVTTIEANGFNGCSYLTSLYMKSSTPPSLAGGLGTVPSSLKIYVPSGSLTAYQTAENWSTYSSKMVEYDPE